MTETTADTTQEHATDHGAQAPSPVVLDTSATAGPGGDAPRPARRTGPQTVQHGLVEHSHGPGSPVPAESRAARTTSFDLADFPLPTGRE